ncbi:ABC transporter permease [Vulgatibacter sp.]|uniref:ABC transporter permease n=1 Tax=Vulgatibacter sp. TaxID=1971226 RepID=UPI0035620C09
MKLLRQAFAFLRRDLQVETSYRANVLLGAVSAFALLVTLYYVGETVGPTRLIAAYGGSYFAFTLIGFAAAAPLHAALLQLARRVREAQMTGTLEAILATPVGPARAVLLSVQTPLLGAALRMAVLLLGAWSIFGLPLGDANLGAAALVLLLALASYVPLGLLSAAFTLRFKRGDPVAAFLDLTSVLLGGVFFPVAVLPPPLQAVAQILPLTHALEGLRLSLLQGAGPSAVAPQLRLLAIAAAVLVPLAFLAFAAAVRRAKADGSLTHF